jgi:hypothetical protein
MGSCCLLLQSVSDDDENVPNKKSRTSATSASSKRAGSKPNTAPAPAGGNKKGKVGATDTTSTSVRRAKRNDSRT